MEFSLNKLLRGQYIRSEEEMIAEYGGVRYVGWSPKTGTVRTNDASALGDSVLPIGPEELEERLMQETLSYLHGFEHHAFNREVYGFGYFVDSGSGRIEPVMNIEERLETLDEQDQMPQQSFWMSPRWYGSNVFGVYPARFGEEFGDLLQARLMLGQANLKGYDEMYGAYTYARPYLFDVRIFDELFRTAAFRVLERLRPEEYLKALNRTDDFMLYFFDHDQDESAMEIVMRELNGDERFERIFGGKA